MLAVVTDFERDSRREIRLAKKYVKLGTGSPICSYCCMSDCRCLFIPKARRNGRGTISCRNCYAKSKPMSSKALDRRRKRFEDAGYVEPACIACQEGDLRALELDHVAGSANSALVEPLCLNHHAIKSDSAEDHFPELRLRDVGRSALAKQAAFEIGLALVLVLIVTLRDEADSLAVFFGMVSVTLLGWASWNIKADDYFHNQFGFDYDRAINAEVPS